MSAKEKLFEALKDNPALREKLAAAYQQNPGVEALTELLRGEGIEPDAEMLREWAADAILAQTLDDKQLENVSGGSWCGSFAENVINFLITVSDT